MAKEIRTAEFVVLPEHAPTSPIDVPSVKANISTEELTSLIKERARKNARVKAS